MATVLEEVVTEVPPPPWAIDRDDPEAVSERIA